MDKFESQFADMDVQTSYMESTMSDTTAMATPQDQVDSLMLQVADEAGLEIQHGLGEAKVPAKEPTLGEASKEEDSNLAERLRALRVSDEPRCVRLTTWLIYDSLLHEGCVRIIHVMCCKMFICTLCTSHDVLDQLLGTDSVTHSSYPVHVRRSPDKHISFTVDPSPLFNPFDISEPLDRYPATGSLWSRGGRFRERRLGNSFRRRSRGGSSKGQIAVGRKYRRNRLEGLLFSSLVFNRSDLFSLLNRRQQILDIRLKCP